MKAGKGKSATNTAYLFIENPVFGQYKITNSTQHLSTTTLTTNTNTNIKSTTTTITITNTITAITISMATRDNCRLKYLQHTSEPQNCRWSYKTIRFRPIYTNIEKSYN